MKTSKRDAGIKDFAKSFAEAHKSAKTPEELIEYFEHQLTCIAHLAEGAALGSMFKEIDSAGYDRTSVGNVYRKLSSNRHLLYGDVK